MRLFGAARSALFNWLFAQKTGGKFLLRIEDTDLQRSTDESTRSIIDGMEWLGLKHDEEIVFLLDGGGAHRHANGRLADAKPNLGFEPLPFAVDEADDGDRRITYQCGDLGDVVEAIFGGRVQYLVLRQRLKPLEAPQGFRTRQVVNTWQLPMPASPDMGGVSADGGTLWLSGRYNAVVYAIDTSTGKLRAEIPVGDGPHGLCVWPQPGRYSLGHTGIMR